MGAMVGLVCGSVAATVGAGAVVGRAVDWGSGVVVASEAQATATKINSNAANLRALGAVCFNIGRKYTD